MEPGRGGPGLLSPYRLTDKPVGYEPAIRGSNPREEAIFLY